MFKSQVSFPSETPFHFLIEVQVAVISKQHSPIILVLYEIHFTSFRA
jgi:hypothetical protein